MTAKLFSPLDAGALRLRNRGVIDPVHNPGRLLRGGGHGAEVVFKALHHAAPRRVVVMPTGPTRRSSSTRWPNSAVATFPSRSREPARNDGTPACFS